MADNFITNAGAGGNTFASDDIAGVHHQRVKVEIGADGAAADVSTANPMPVSDAGGSLTVDGTVTLGAGAANIGDVDVLSVPAPLSTTGGGTEATALRVTIANDSTGLVSVDDNGGALTVDQATASNLNAQVQGNIAHDGIDSGNPVKIGARAVAHGANPAAVAAADRADALCNRAGVPFVIGGHPNVITVGVLVTDANGAQTDISLTGTIGAGTKVVVTRATVLADNANTADVACRIGFGAANVPTPTTTGVAGMILDHRGVPAGGGVTVGDGSGIIGVGADGEELRYTCEDPVGGNLTIQVSYYTIES
jgi:hypothetical protein